MSIFKNFKIQFKQPKVSCVCLTNQRPHLLKRAIQCFVNQSYNNKEMIIVHKDNDLPTIDYLSGLNYPDIKTVSLSSAKSYTLGELRNISIENTNGVYFCQWDDDDWYHNRRIETQLKASLSAKKAGSVLMNLLFHNTITGESYLSFDRPWENSILCHKAIHKNFKYPSLNKEEDTRFVKSIHDEISHVEDCPYYIYVFHNNNTWNQAHFQHLFSLSLKLEPPICEGISKILSGSLNNSQGSDFLDNHISISQLKNSLTM